MSDATDLRGTGEKFSEVLEAHIEAGKGLFEVQDPFLRTACRGLAKRLNGEFVPGGFAHATYLYIHDISRGKDGYSGEPMPAEVVGASPIMHTFVMMAAEDIALEAFGEEFVAAVNQRYDAIREQS